MQPLRTTLTTAWILGHHASAPRRPTGPPTAAPDRFDQQHPTRLTDRGRTEAVPSCRLTLPFAYAAQHHMLDGVTGIDQRLLDTIEMMAAGARPASALRPTGNAPS